MKKEIFRMLPGKYLRSGWLAVAALVSGGALAQQDVDVIQVGIPTVVILDQSGSMGGGFEWLGRLMTLSDATLQRNNGADAGGGYGLVGFIDEPVVVALGDAPYVTAGEFERGVVALKTAGGKEDGYRAIRYVLDQFGLDGNSRVHIVLISNEDRDALDPELNVQVMADMLAASGSVLDVLVDARFRCSDGRQALGQSASGGGFALSSQGEVVQCAGVSAVAGHSDANTSVQDYVDLALNSGGSAWDIYRARVSRTRSPAFAEAFAAARTALLQQQTAAAPYLPIINSSSVRPVVGEMVTLDGSASSATTPDGSVQQWEWDTDADGSFDMYGPVVATSFAQAGRHAVRLRVGSRATPSLFVERVLLLEVVEASKQ